MRKQSPECVGSIRQGARNSAPSENNNSSAWLRALVLLANIPWGKSQGNNPDRHVSTFWQAEVQSHARS